jgi:MioC protein
MSSTPVRITILVGTMTGTAQLVAQELELAWDGRGDEGRNAGDGRARQLGVRAPGRVPDLHVDLRTGRCARQRESAVRRSAIEASESFAGALRRVRLGDRTYAETFNFGGKRFDDILSELGAQRIGERVQHDASSGVLPEETAQEWGNEWLTLAREAFAQAA